MKNKQYPPRGGPPLVYRCRGSGWRGFQTAHLNIILARIEEDVGPPGGFLSPNLQGFGNLEGLKSRNKAREPAWLATKGESHYPGSIAVGIAVGFNQRKEDVHARTGLQPHLFVMRLKPEELVCSSVTRQLKQTAMEEKQMPLKKNEIAMDSLYGSPNLQGFGNLEGLRFGLTSCSRAREPAGHPPEAVCRSGTGTERARDGTMVRNPVVHSFAGIAVGFNQRTEKAHAGTGLQPHLFVMRLKPEELFCSIVPRQLKQTAMEEKQTAMAREAAGHPPEKVCRSGTGTERTGRRDGTMVHIRDDTGLHIRHGTDLGSRNAAASRPVHPPEWERYGRRRRKCRMMNIEYSIMNEETGNVDPGSRKSEDGRQKSEPETGNIKFSCMRNEF